MVPTKSLDEFKLIAALLRDVQTLHGEVITPRALRLTTDKVAKRMAQEGIGFLTKTLPRLGKALDRALSGEVPLVASEVAFDAIPGGKLPRFLGELFQKVFTYDGWVLPNPCVQSVKDLRNVLYSFYKYKLPYDPNDEANVITRFREVETDLAERVCPSLSRLEQDINRWVDSPFSRARLLSAICSEGGFSTGGCKARCNGEPQNAGIDTPEPVVTGSEPSNGGSAACQTQGPPNEVPEDLSYTACSRPELSRDVLRTSNDSGLLTRFIRTPNSCRGEFCPARIILRARSLLSEVFARFDPTNVIPRHGPGAVSTKERLWSKFEWTRVASRIRESYPLDAYFYASLGHVCDRIDEINSLDCSEAPARVCLVPKDSRGPRLISCEPVDFQWIQQGLGRAIVDHLESHPLTRFGIHFTNQQPNQFGALLGSMSGKYATLDLKDASDRVSVELVRLLFPKRLSDVLMNCRTLGTILPSGEYLPLRKFAPMGSALCFPVLATCIWSLLAASVSNADTRESILVYGDDVIVPTAFADIAIRILESFGLRVNRDKSCVNGFFRESCGVDAFHGVNVTPVRFRTRWTYHRGPDVYTSWIAYANQCWHRQYYNLYDEIVRRLFLVYKEIPAQDMNLSCPSLVDVPERNRPRRRRVNSNLQKLEYYVYDVTTPVLQHELPGWSMLLRFFVGGGSKEKHVVLEGNIGQQERPSWDRRDDEPVSVSLYTERRASMLVRRWR